MKETLSYVLSSPVQNINKCISYMKTLNDKYEMELSSEIEQESIDCWAALLTPLSQNRVSHERERTQLKGEFDLWL